MKKALEKKVEASLEQLLALCQEKVENVKERNNVLWEVIDSTVKIIEEEGIDEYEKMLEKAREDYNRCYSQLFGMLELAQAIYDPEDKVGYFKVDSTDDWKVDKVVFQRFDDEQ